VITLKQISSGRVFSKYLIKSKEVSIMSDDWEIGTHTFSESKQVRIKKGATIDKVTDELGNIYFETEIEKVLLVSATIIPEVPFNYIQARCVNGFRASSEEIVLIPAY
jgi:hypothetical protein